jgi:ketosteroid isomerase-like protein
MKPLLVALLTVSLAAPAHAQTPAEKSPAGQVSEADLASTLARYSDASAAFYDGRPEAVWAMWSHADDVTLSGAAGGPTAKGWSEVSKRLGWASAQFKGARGAKSVELVHASVSGDLAYIVQYEHIRYTPPGNVTESKRDYRVTTIFRREPEGWRVVHRHADTLMERQDIR